ncbi:NADH-quinone oxidoreductase subunit L [bacterium DOLJORAL78_65_58]|nr:MAG: NADH-quinone oxidoreductase subunit L [bacterium DOLZORAL124_64_63]PIE75989.1 MAG: NADH-quinone oxidoreductase subunit L [bacterium DOLJORAL78_65_58]
MLRWIVLIPLLGAAVNGLLNRRLPKQAAGLLASAAVGASFVMSVLVFLRLTGMDADHRFVSDTVATWMGFGNFRVDIGFAMDPLSGIMALVVTGVGFLIHIYSIGYMAHDKGFQRFFTYLNLFIFAMMMLVLGENLLMLFVGWEGVGLCSYLLISFWFGEEANAAAGKKAFVVNRIGDFGFLIGMFLIGVTLLPHLDGEGVFSFRTMAHHGDLLAPVATAICLLLFVGATGKSAQIPLYIWLPDAMAGPTPVSALIHAATMVTAGVYMIARMNFLFVLSPTALSVVAVVGTVTAIFASSIALVQNDIKKVLAYSTVSQLGYMMLACGVGAFAAGIFHVMTHAFFKALLFLGSGSVIHAMSDEQDMRLMGGLGRHMPITSKTFYVGTIAIAGVFPLAGFFSKDEILWKAWSSGHQVLWAIGFLAAGMTAFYMARLVVMTFFGKNRASEEVRSHIHESPLTMTVPLIVLAVLSVVGGWVGIPHFMGGANHFEHWLEPVFASHAAVAHHGAEVAHHGAAAAHAAGHAAAGHAHHDTTMEWILAACSLALGILGLLAGYVVYSRKISVADTFRNLAGGRLHRILLNKYYVDEAYEAVFIRPGYFLGKKILWKGVDAGFIDGLLVNGSALLVYMVGSLVRVLQNSMVRFYAWCFTIGAAVFFLYLSFSG